MTVATTPSRVRHWVATPPRQGRSLDVGGSRASGRGRRRKKRACVKNATLGDFFEPFESIGVPADRQLRESIDFTTKSTGATSPSAEQTSLIFDEQLFVTGIG